MAKDNELKMLAARIDSLEKRIAKIEGSGTVSTTATVSPTMTNLSLREFLISKKPDGDVKRALTVAYYLQQFGGQVSVSVADLEAGFDRAKEKKPLNMNDKINLSIRNGHMDEAEEKKNNRKAWVLTDSGRALVEQGFKK